MFIFDVWKFGNLMVILIWLPCWGGIIAEVSYHDMEYHNSSHLTRLSKNCLIISWCSVILSTALNPDPLSIAFSFKFILPCKK